MTTQPTLRSEGGQPVVQENHVPARGQERAGLILHLAAPPLAFEST